MELPPYQYQTLPTEDAIRILALDPADSHEDDLTCSILIESRSQLLQSTDDCINHYEAVSYAWGIPEFSKLLVCDGTTVVKITPNVEILLRRLRKGHRVRNLWIDAVCLDQANNAEKAQQVPLMALIYHQASKVLIWLGDDPLVVPQIFALIRKLATLEDATDGTIVQLAEDILGKDKSREHLESFFCRPWFHRRWILQEASKGRSAVVRCHREKMAWKWFVDGCERLRTSSENQSNLDVLSRRALDTVQMIEAHGDDLLELLWNLDHAQCSVLNDRLFALYGLLKWKDIPLRVDYEVPWQLNYTNFAAYCISEHGLLEILRHIVAFGSLGDSDSTSPSWVPDWSRLRHKFLPTWKIGINGTMSDCVRSNINSTSSILHLRCSVVTISHIFKPSKVDWSLAEMAGWVQTFNLIEPPDEPDTSRARHLWTTHDEKIFEVIVLGLSRFLDTSTMPPRQQRAIHQSLDFFKGNFTISSEYVYSRREILLPWIRKLLEDYTLYACDNGNQVCMFGVGSGAVQLGDGMTLEDKTIWDKDAYCKFGCVIRSFPGDIGDGLVAARMVGVCVHPGRYRVAIKLEGNFTYSIT